MSEQIQPDPEPVSDIVRKEIHAVIRRYGDESGITVYQMLGVLRVVEHDLIEMLNRCRES